MLSLLRMDLYRLVHDKEFRGWLIALTAVFAFAVAFLFFVTTPAFTQMVMANMEDATTAENVALNAIADFTERPTAVWGDMAMVVLVSLATSAFMAVHVAADYKCGYVRNVLSARTGRAAYFAAKLVLIVLVAIAFLALSLLVVNVLWTALGFSYAEGESASDILLWCVSAVLLTTAYGSIACIVVWFTRSQAVGLAVACLVGSGIVGGIVGSCLSFYGAAIPFCTEAYLWLPSTQLRVLQAGWPNGGADPGEVLRMLVCTVGMTVLCAALTFGIARRRDA